MAMAFESFQFACGVCDLECGSGDPSEQFSPPEASGESSLRGADVILSKQFAGEGTDL
jgi:hypothetical protein